MMNARNTTTHNPPHYNPNSFRQGSSTIFTLTQRNFQHLGEGVLRGGEMGQYDDEADYDKDVKHPRGKMMMMMMKMWASQGEDGSREWSRLLLRCANSF